MKNTLVMVGVGVALCCVTVGGLLGAQGRLNYEGTKNIPLLSALFTPPARPTTTTQVPSVAKKRQTLVKKAAVTSTLR